MEKNITIKDIARQAGVSVATVSYVINNRTDQRISEETKKKVLQIVNLLDYQPNSSAKSLATNKTNCIALYFMTESSLFKRSEQLLVIESLTQVMKTYGYHLVVKSIDDVERLNQVDAILCYDVTLEYFQQLGDKNFIPLVGLDMIIPIPLFYKVCNDYHHIKAMADTTYGENNYTLLTLKPNNESVLEHMESLFSKVRYISNHDDVRNIKEPVVYYQSSLDCLLEDRPDTLYVPMKHEEKYTRVCTCIEAAINRVPDMEHQYFI